MRPVTQTVDYPSGDCFRACLCSLLELPIEAIPNFQENEGEKFEELYRKFNDDSKYRMVSITCENPEITLKGCMVIAHGKSPGKDYNHSVIWQDGRIIHDPHESKKGIVKPELFTVLIKKIW